jgi:predicted PurR-regulated permease PerM
MNKNEQISSVKIKQVFLLAIILILAALICYNLALFIPSVLGAITIYVVCRRYNFICRKKKVETVACIINLMFASLVILILPIYFIGDLLIEKLGNAQAYMDKFNVFLEKIHTYIFDKVGFDILSKENMDKLKSSVGQFSTKALSGTLNTMTVVMSVYFILYFMLAKPRLFERILSSSAPLKRSNVSMIGEK